MRRSTLVLFAVVTTASADAKDPYAGWRDPIGKIVGGSYDGAVYTQLADLGDTVGPRVTGTPRYAKAVDWGIAQLKAAGAQNVHVEKFSMEHGWQRGTARAAVIAPTARSLHVESQGWSPSTPTGGVRGQVIRVRFDALPPPAQLKGKIVLYAFDELPPGQPALFKTGLDAVKNGGAIAMLSQRNLPNNVMSVGSPTTGGRLASLPMAAIGHEDGLAITRQLANGPVTVELAITNTISGPIQVANVIGELRGRDRPDEWLVIGGHLDSWDFATGTQDNGAGLVQVIQTARLLAASGPLRRTVRFVLWGGEEQGSNGSFAYVDAHAGELKSCVMALNTDNGAGHVTGWKVANRADVRIAVTPIADRLLASLGGGKVDMALSADSDHFSFVQAGVPTIDLLVEDGNYDLIHHTQGDTIDKIDPHALASGLAVIAVTAFAIASSNDRFGALLDRAGVERLLKPGGYDQQLRAEGRWK